jgi:hypothetical protein
VRSGTVGLGFFTNYECENGVEMQRGYCRGSELPVTTSGNDVTITGIFGSEVDVAMEAVAGSDAHYFVER